MDAKCLYNLYDASGQHVGSKEFNNYIDDNELNISQSDPDIDSYKSKYDKYTTLQVQNSNINNKLSNTDSTYSQYNSKVSQQNKLDDMKFKQTLTNLKNDHKDRTDMIISQIENFENSINEKYDKNNKYFLILFLIIICIIFIYIYGYCK